MTHYLAFLLASFLLLITPGPAVLFIVSRSLDQGPKAGVISVAGITVGGLMHVLFAVCGLSALVAASATAFLALKYAGAAYLIYLGIMKLLEKPAPTGERAPLRAKVFWQAFWVELLNPKVALFFLSFLPQFVDVSKGNVTQQILFLGLSYVALAFFTDSTYALAAGKFGLIARQKAGGIGKWVSGFTYLSLGIATAVTGKK